MPRKTQPDAACPKLQELTGGLAPKQSIENELDLR
jgi:hypothetical protein